MIIKKDKFCTILFFVAYFFLLSFSFLGHVSFLGGYLNLFSKLSTILFVFIIILQINKYYKKEVFLSMFFVGVSLFITIKNNDPSLFKLFLLLFSMKTISFDDCLKFDSKIRSILIILTVFLCFIGIAPDLTTYYAGSYKHSFGFSNPNAFGMHTLILVVEFMYLNKNKLSLLKTILILSILFIVDSYAGCRSSFLVFFLVFIFFKLLQLMPNILEKKFIKIFVKNSFFLFSILTFFLFLLYNNGTSIGIFLNNVLSNRLYNINNFSTLYEINLFGSDLSLSPTTLDTLYAYCLYGYGLIAYVFLIIIFKKLFNYLYDEKEYNLIIIMFSFFVYGLSERLWFMIDYNIFMATLSLILFKNKNQNKKY